MTLKQLCKIPENEFLYPKIVKNDLSKRKIIFSGSFINLSKPYTAKSRQSPRKILRTTPKQLKSRKPMSTGPKVSIFSSIFGLRALSAENDFLDPPTYSKMIPQNQQNYNFTENFDFSHFSFLRAENTRKIGFLS